MTLFQQRRQFSLMVPKLLWFIHNTGKYDYTLGDLMAKSGHCRGSFHYKGLALDINLFLKDGTYLTKTEDHQEIGEWWEHLGGSWGGRFAKPDGNHYSLGEDRSVEYYND